MSWVSLFELFIISFHSLGLYFAVKSVFETRTSQGAVAWCISLVTFPYVAVPLYLVFGSFRFRGYVEALKSVQTLSESERLRLEASLQPFFAPLPADAKASENVFESLAKFDFSYPNDVELYHQGKVFFDAVFEAISNARSYVLIEFFIVKDDKLGRDLQELLIRTAKKGIKIYFLFDRLGSYALPESYLEELRTVGVEIFPFYSGKGIRNRFQINFRNHRKIVVVDGQIAFAGGHNVGEEYLGKHKRFGTWRDTSVRVLGPAILNIQRIFLGDWIWSTGKIIELNWGPIATKESDTTALAIGTGPVEGREGCSLMYLQLINMASKRLWISSPYFVPDEAIIKALQLAAARGVDVRIIIPSRPDHIMVWLASFSYLQECIEAGIQLLRYQPGFLHQKAVLVDDAWSCVGTVNLDNRSLRLNFEISIMCYGTTFAKKVEEMFQTDLAASKLVSIEEYTDKPYLFKTAVQISRLLAPIL